MDCSLLGSSVHGISQTKILEWAFIFLRDLSDPGIEPTSPAWQADSLPLIHLFFMLFFFNVMKELLYIGHLCISY